MALLRRGTPPLRRWLAGLWVAAAVMGQNQPGQAPEDDIKAAYLYNFAKFVDWPPDAAHDGPIIVCVLADDSFATAVENVSRGKTANGRTLAVRRNPELKDLRSCHILFVGTPEARRLDKLLPIVRSSGVLTVGEAEGFTRFGGVIGFLVEDNKVRFEINVEAAARSRLRISSKLLRVARVVQEP